MKRKLLVLLLGLFLASSAYASNKWMNGSATFMDGDAIYFNDVDLNVNNYILEPLNRYLANSRAGMYISYSSASAVSVGTGSIVCTNSGTTLYEIRQNTASTSVGWADIDTGAEASATTYYIYANCDADATTATFKISASSSTPTGLTLYRRIGSFYNDASSNITRIVNDNEYHYFGTPVSKSVSVTYQALTDGLVVGYTTANSTTTSITYTAYSDSSSSPTTVVQYMQSLWVSGAPGQSLPIMFPVRKGDYYSVTCAAGATLNFVPTGT